MVGLRMMMAAVIGVGSCGLCGVSGREHERDSGEEEESPPNAAQLHHRSSSRAHRVQPNRHFRDARLTAALSHVCRISSRSDKPANPKLRKS